MRLADIAPRLAAARDAWLAAARARDLERRGLVDDRLRLERLVAHRDLQLIRAAHQRGARCDRKYMAERLAKLKEAESALERVYKRLAELDVAEREAQR